ncbi:MAG: site-specific integrase [Rhodospirillales bacterium]|nr:site-specific integrase [Rhodospirillales bacterium]
MIEDMTVRNLSPATQRSYIYAVAKFSRYFGRSPDRLDLEDVRAYQVQLVARGISWPALNQIVCALRFFYGVTLRRSELPERIPHAREPRKLPLILSADEVVRFLEAVPGFKSRTALTTAYAAGLRASEAARLKVSDVDSSRMMIRIEEGKGAKDRYAMLSPQLLTILRGYWRLVRPRHWLFPGRDRGRPIDPQALHAACRSACTASGLAKRVTVTRCATASRPTCWRPAPTSGSSRFCWVTATCRRQPATRKWLRRRSAARPARSTGCVWRWCRPPDGPPSWHLSWRWRRSSAATATPIVRPRPATSA